MHSPHPLPQFASELCERLHAPVALVKHLTVVHDAAVEILDGLNAFPQLSVDLDAVLFGAATHDIGKVVHPEELTGPGDLHELAGEQLLLEQGVKPQWARYARTHGHWHGEPLEDHLVALADHLWRGKRDNELEGAVATLIAAATGMAVWEVTLKLDEICEGVALDGEARLAWAKT